MSRTNRVSALSSRPPSASARSDCDRRHRRLAAMASEARGSPGWLPANDLTLTGDVARPTDVAMDPVNTIAVWQRQEGGGFEHGHRGVRAPGERRRMVRRRGDFRPRRARQLAADRRRCCRQRTCRLERGRIPDVRGSSRVPPGGDGDVAAAETVSSNGFDPYVASDTAGNASAIWLPDRGSYREVQASVRPAATGIWEPAADLSLGRNAFGQAIWVNPEVARSWCGSRTTSCPRSSTRASGRRAGPGNPIGPVSPSWEDAL